MNSQHIQPKIPPTPNLEKLAKGIRASNPQIQFPICPNHPHKQAEYCLQESPYIKVCLKCAISLGGGQSFVPTQKHKKKEGIELFRTKIGNMKNQIHNLESQIRESVEECQQSLLKEKARIKEIFDDLMEDINEKRNELTSHLMQSYHAQKKSFKRSIAKAKEIEQSLQRYLFDVNKNYDSIIEQLSLPNVHDILKQYDEKLAHHQNGLQKLSNQTQNNVSVYIPYREMLKVLKKSSVGGLEQFCTARSESEDQKRSLQKDLRKKRVYTSLREKDTKEVRQKQNSSAFLNTQKMRMQYMATRKESPNYPKR